MAKFEITYKSKTDNDSVTVWTTADYASEAIDNVLDDYWDVCEILYVKQISND